MERRRFLKATGVAAGVGGLGGAGVRTVSASHTQTDAADRFVAADSTNYSTSNRGVSDVNWIVIHYTVGSYNGAISWFQNSDADVSAHYVIKNYDDWQDFSPGHVTQMVHHEDVAWHASGSNSQSIGIEHEWYDDGPVYGFTDECYQASAELVVELAELYDIPLEYYHDHTAMCNQPGGIIGHQDSTTNSWCGSSNSTSCPGPFDPDVFMDYVEDAAGGGSGGGSANFSLSGWSASPTEVEPNEPVTVSGQVENVGDATDDAPIECYRNGEYYATEWVSDLAGGSSTAVSFDVSADDLGTHDLWVFEFYDGVGDDWEGTFDVVEDTGEADFEVHSWSVDPSVVEPGDPVTVSGQVENVGDATDDVAVECYRNGGYYDTEWVSDLSPGDSVPVAFEVTEDELGSHDLWVFEFYDDTVGDDWEGTFDVVEDAEDGAFSANERVAATGETVGRESPGDDAGVVGTLEPEDDGIVLDGPDFTDGKRWWELYVPALDADAWIVEDDLEETGRFELETIVWTSEEDVEGREQPGHDQTLVAVFDEHAPARVINGPAAVDGETWWGLHVPGDGAWAWVTEDEIELFPSAFHEGEAVETSRGTIGWTGDDQVHLPEGSDATVQDGPLEMHGEVYWSVDPEDVGGWWWVRHGDLETTEYEPRAVLPFDTTTNLNDPVTIDVEEMDAGTAIDQAIATVHNTESPLIGLGDALVAVGEALSVNALYVLAHAAHESAWGTSLIAQDKHNLFGWGAVDDDPYEGAEEYDSFEQCLWMVAAQIKDLYLTPGNWRYQGPHLEGMNEYYATDPDWADAIAATYADLATVIDDEAFDPTDPPEPTFEPGDPVQTTVETDGHELPGLTTDVVATLAEGTDGEVLDGPELIDMHHWWKLDTDGLEEDVWVVESHLQAGSVTDCHLMGDVVGDGTVSSLDATATLRHIAGLPVDAFDETCADMTGDGAVTSADVTAIQQVIVGTKDAGEFPLTHDVSAAGTARLTLEVDERTDDGTVRVSLSTNASDVAGYQASIAFDPDVLALERVDGSAFAKPTVNVDGRGFVALVAGRADGVRAPTLATVEFEVVGDGPAEIEVLEAACRLNDEDEREYALDVDGTG